jgi:hypothetical protein
MTLNKVLRARKLLLDLENEETAEFHIVVKPYQLEDMLKLTQVGSIDYDSVRALLEGKLTRFVGFDWHVSTRLLTDASGYRRIPCWVKDKVVLGTSSDIETKIDQLPTKNYSTQVYVGMDIGAVRMEEAGVVEIKCLEA